MKLTIANTAQVVQTVLEGSAELGGGGRRRIISTGVVGGDGWCWLSAQPPLKAGVIKPLHIQSQKSPPSLVLSSPAQSPNSRRKSITAACNSSDAQQIASTKSALARCSGISVEVTNIHSMVQPPDHSDPGPVLDTAVTGDQIRCAALQRTTPLPNRPGKAAAFEPHYSRLKRRPRQV